MEACNEHFYLFLFFLEELMTLEKINFVLYNQQKKKIEK